MLVIIGIHHYDHPTAKSWWEFLTTDKSAQDLKKEQSEESSDKE
jgi:hypothetical protein